MNETMQTLFSWLHVDTLTEFWWVVFGLAGHGGDQSAYDQLWELESQTELQEEKMEVNIQVGF